MKPGLTLALQDSIRHFICTLLGEMVLVRNVGHRCQAITENDLAKQLNSATEFSNHNKW